MITFLKWIRLCQLRVKYKLIFYDLLDKTVKDVNTGKLKDNLLKEIMPYIAEFVHAQTMKDRETEKNNRE